MHRVSTFGGELDNNKKLYRLNKIETPRPIID